MDTQQNIEERLWDFIDGNCSEQEKSFIQQLVESNLQWRAKYTELLEVHQLMQNSLELDEPSLRFRQNVMEEIAKHQIAPATKSYINKNIIRGIGAFFIIMVLGFIISGFAQVNWSDTSSGFNLPLDFAKLDWSKFFNNTYTNIFMMVNIVLGLMLLDMYLGKKKKEVQNKTEL
jgi:regulatory protein YycI of two-component signal transduction system YycFG